MNIRKDGIGCTYIVSVENMEGSEHIPGGHVKLALSVLTKKGG